MDLKQLMIIQVWFREKHMCYHMEDLLNSIHELYDQYYVSFIL